MNRNLLAAFVASGAVLAGGAAWLLHQEALKERWSDAAPSFPAPKDSPALLTGYETARGFQFRAKNRDPESLGQLAEYHLANGNHAHAEAALRGLLAFDRENAKWPHLLGRQLADEGRLDEAIPLLRQAAALAPRSVSTWLRLGDALAKSNQAAGSTEAYHQVLEIDARNPWARLGLARLEIANERWTAARLLLEDAARDTPEFSAAHNLLATAYERSGRNADAERSRARAAALGRFAEARDPWADLLWRSCYDPYRLRVTAATYATTGRLPQALAVLEHARSLAPNDARTQRELGRLLLKLGRPADAQATLEETARLEPAEPAAYLDLLEAARMRNDDAAIDTVIARGLVHCPNSAGLHYAQAKRLIAADKPAAAEIAIANAIRLEPESPTGYETHAIVLLQLGRGDEALRAIETGLSRAPHAAPLWRLLFHYHQQRGDSAAAAQVIARAQSAGVRAELLRE